MGSLVLGIYFLGFVAQQGLSLFIDGCPMFGCRPSGSFSFYLQIPRQNVSIKWISDFELDPVPTALGCVSDSVNIVCPSNGPFSEDKGYVSLFTGNGTIRWRDYELHFPTLPLLDNFGDVTGSDGKKLVHYDADGKGYPSLPCDGLYPLFNMALVGDSNLLLVSGDGLIVVRETNGIPVGSLTLNATCGGVNGTFLPIAQPVINEQRFYVLTEFMPLSDKHIHTSDVVNRRLYAVDVHESISNRIKVAWFMDFPYKLERLVSTSNKNLEYDKTYTLKERLHAFRNGVTSDNASLLWNRYNSTIYLISPTADGGSQSTLFGVRDKGGEGEVIFHSRLAVSQMAMFVSDHCEFNSKCNSNEKKNRVIGPMLWAVTKGSEIHQISDQGISTHVINLKNLFKSSVAMTTKLSLVRNSDTDNDILLFGIKMTDEQELLQQEVQTTYVVAIDTANDGILWSIPVPDNMIPLGQITGVSGTDMRVKDQMIVYAETSGKSAKIFSID